MAAQKLKFQLNLSGLLKVLAEHLYSTKKVAIRELIQNAHDSIIRRQTEKMPEDYQPVISIISDPQAKTLTIKDNGAGMTDDEISTYLATLGNSYTRDLSQQLQFGSPEAAERLIGQFGLGFLSAFLIAAEISLTTRSYKSEQAYLWTSDGSEYFTLQPTDHNVVGTIITIKVKPEAQYLLQESILIETIRTYADFLPLPIYVNGSNAAVNLMTPPWKAADPIGAMNDYIQRAFGNQDSIAIIPLHDEEIDLGHDKLDIPINGFVFIPTSSVVSLREYGDLRVYIRGMFITEEDRYLLPKWARFMRGVIDCPGLQPTAAREALHQEENYLAAQQALEGQLLASLRQIANEKPDVWRKIVTGHTDLVLGWVVANNDFFDEVADIVLLRSTRGLITMPDYLQQSNNTFYFSTREIGSLQEQLLGEGYEVPVIDASWFGVRSFLEKYASRHAGIRLVQMDGEAKLLLRPVDEQPYSALVKHFRDRNMPVKIANFKPSSVPAIILYPLNADAIRRARDALDSGELSGPLNAMVSDYLSQQASTPESIEEAEHGMLYLNAASPLIQRLRDGSSPQIETILELVHQIARLFAGHFLTPETANEAFQSITNSIQGLMSDE